MPNFIRSFIQNNTKDVFKSIPHFLRSGATYSILMQTFAIVFYPVAKILGHASNYSVIDSVLIILISVVVLYLSKLFIKE